MCHTHQTGTHTCTHTHTAYTHVTHTHTTYQTGTHIHTYTHAIHTHMQHTGTRIHEHTQPHTHTHTHTHTTHHTPHSHWHTSDKEPRGSTAPGEDMAKAGAWRGWGRTGRRWGARPGEAPPPPPPARGSGVAGSRTTFSDFPPQDLRTLRPSEDQSALFAGLHPCTSLGHKETREVHLNPGTVKR